MNLISVPTTYSGPRPTAVNFTNLWFQSPSVPYQSFATFPHKALKPHKIRLLNCSKIIKMYIWKFRKFKFSPPLLGLQGHHPNGNFTYIIHDLQLFCSKSAHPPGPSEITFVVGDVLAAVKTQSKYVNQSIRKVNTPGYFPSLPRPGRLNLHGIPKISIQCNWQRIITQHKSTRL